MRLLQLVTDGDRNSFLSRNNVGLIGMWEELQIPGDRQRPFLQAMVEAWDWLEHHGLVALRPGESSWAYVTNRGAAVAGANGGLAIVKASARLDLDLHPLIARDVRQQFILGKYELAVIAAMRAVEISVRELSGASGSEVGVRLMQRAFGADGPLRDELLDPGEQEAMTALFRGAIGVFKNPSSHRQVDFDDPTLAAEIVLFADFLLRMLDRVPSVQ